MKKNISKLLHSSSAIIIGGILIFLVGIAVGHFFIDMPDEQSDRCQQSSVNYSHKDGKNSHSKDCVGEQNDSNTDHRGRR